jgi:diaminohydroxyphosphoribosylaminopyrimidine deaminase / 5-amino-6-(5-phosphoribosylamino)uracil reductase
MSSEADFRWMRRAIALSRRGFPAPNPHVGCVLVVGDACVGEGFHPFAGGPHAEAVALSAAGERARGGTAYVTLEPCAHFGRTPPCADALIDAGVARVVVACADPNPRAAGGATRLREAGVTVEVGLLEEEAARANVMFLFAHRTRRPYVVAKAAATLDGRLALPSGESRWITGEAARRRGHRLRAECGAVLVGSGTVRCDDPRLTARVPGVRNQPLRIVLDPKRELTGREAVFHGPGEPIRVVDGAAGPGEWSVPAVDGAFDLASLLSRLHTERGVVGLLVEGGAATLAGFVRADLVDRFELFLAPKLFGAGRSWLEGLDVARLAEAPEVKILRTRRIGDDLWLTGEPRRRRGDARS